MIYVFDVVFATVKFLSNFPSFAIVFRTFTFVRCGGFYFDRSIIVIWGRVADWLELFARKPKAPDLSPVASYVQRWVLCSNQPANVSVSLKRVEVTDRSLRKSPLPLLSCESWMFVWENPDRKKINMLTLSSLSSFRHSAH